MAKAVVTFIISSGEGPPKGASAPSLSIWDFLQVYQGVGERLPVHLEHLTSVSVLPGSAQHQPQLKQEDVQPLQDATKEGEGCGFILVFTSGIENGI